MNTELVHKDTCPIEPPLSEIGQLIVALGNEIDIAKLEKLLQMKREQDELERSLQAREAYLAAKSKFLGLFDGPIPCDKTGQVGNVKFRYASYGQILKCALPHMAACGLSHTTTPDWNANLLTCSLKHIDGHEEQATFPLSTEGQKQDAATSQQKHAHSLTYAERQAFKSVSGVPVADEDVDAKPPKTDQRRDDNERANQIKRDWLAPRHELDGKSPADQSREFAAWFLTHTNATTFSPHVTRWTDEQLDACRTQLDKEAAARSMAHKEGPPGTDAHSTTETEDTDVGANTEGM